MLEGQLSQLSTEVERLFDEARGRARRELADQLNQSVRRIRHSQSLDELTATLLDAAMAFAAGAAIFRIADGAAHGDKIRGVAAEEAGAFAALEIRLSAAPALAGAVETRDPVIAVTTAAEVSARIVSLAAHPADGRAYIYPLVLNNRVPALLYCWGAGQGAALEMLAQVAAAVWDSLVEPEPPVIEPPPLVNIAAAPAPAAPASWEALSPEDQAIHLARAAVRARAGRGDAIERQRRGAIRPAPNGISMALCARASMTRAQPFGRSFSSNVQHGGLHPCGAGADFGARRCGPAWQRLPRPSA